jgi:hypothetical protein
VLILLNITFLKLFLNRSYLWGVIDATRTQMVENGSAPISGSLYPPYASEAAGVPIKLWLLGGATGTIALGYRSGVDDGGIDGQVNGPWPPTLAVTNKNWLFVCCVIIVLMIHC